MNKKQIGLTEQHLHQIIKESIKCVVDENRKNVRRIRITALADMGRNKELFMSKVLMLRHARNVGDEENVNNTVLGALKRNGSRIKFEIVG